MHVRVVNLILVFCFRYHQSCQAKIAPVVRSRRKLLDKCWIPISLYRFHLNEPGLGEMITSV